MLVNILKKKKKICFLLTILLLQISVHYHSIRILSLKSVK